MNFLCQLCREAAVETLVKVLYNGRLEEKVFYSGLKAEDWAIDTEHTPCELVFIYECKKCGNEQTVYRRYIEEATRANIPGLFGSKGIPHYCR